MCGRYQLYISLDELVERYGLDDITDLQADYSPREEIFPSEQAPVVMSREGRQRQLKLFNWGFPVSFSKRLLINARAETIDSKATFREAFLQRRCLVPANAFFEWKQTGNGKQKYRISTGDQQVFSLAGIYQDFQNKEGKDVPCFTIITTIPNECLQPIHNRMPVIIRPDREETWLDPARDPEDLKLLLTPYPAGQTRLKNGAEQLKLNLN